MDNIQQHRNPHTVSSIDQHFQLLRRTKPGGCGKEIGHLVAKRGIVRVLHNGHNLDGIIAQRLDFRQDMHPEFLISAYLSVLLSHTDVALVDKQLLLGLKFTVRPCKFRFRVPNHAVPLDGHRVLLHPVDIQRNPLQLSAAGYHYGHYLLTVLQAVSTGQKQCKHAVFSLFHGIGVSIPAAEITGQVQLLRCRRPLPVDPAIFCFVETEIQMSRCKILQRLTIGQKLFFLFLKILLPQIKVGLVGLQKGIVTKNCVFHKYQLPSLLA